MKNFLASLFFLFLLIPGALSQWSIDEPVSVLEFEPEYGNVKVRFTIYSAEAESRLLVSMRGLIVTGNTKYRNIDISEVLIPHSLNYNVICLSGNVSVYELDTVIPLAYTGKRVLLASIALPSVNEEILIRVMDCKVYKSDEFDKRLKDKTTEIDSYYDLNSALDDVDALVEKTNLSSLKDMPPLMLQLEDMLDNMQAYNVRMENWGSKLDDPLDIASRLPGAIQKIKRKLESLENSFDHLYVHYLDQAVAFYNNDDMQAALKAAGRAFYLNTSYWPAAEFNIQRYNEMMLPAKSDSIMRLFVDANGIAEPEKEDVRLSAASILDVYLGVAEQMIKSEEFINAIVLIDKGLSFAEKLNLPSYVYNLEELKGSSRQGIINSYGRISKRAMNSGRPQLAMEYAQKAGIYLLGEENSGDISGLNKLNTGILVELYQGVGSGLLDLGYYSQGLKLLQGAEELCTDPNSRLCLGLHGETTRGLNLWYDHILALAESFYNIGDYSASEVRLEEAEAIRKQYAGRITSSSREAYLLRLIQTEKRKVLIGEMKLALKENKPGPAYDLLAEICMIEKEYSIPEEPFTDSIINIILEPVIVDSMEKASFLVWKNELDDAYVVMENVRALGALYNFRNDSLFRVSFDNLNEEIITKKCFNAESEYKQMLIKAKASTRNLQYLEADNFLESAEGIIEMHKDICSLNKIEARSLRKKSAAPTEYQQRIENIVQDIRKQEFDQVQKAYEDAGNFFSNHRLKRTGLLHPGYLEFVKNKGNNEFLAYTAIQYSWQDNAMIAFELLQTLRNRACESEKTIEAQKAVGNALAIKDKREGSLSNPKTYVFRYTEKDPWYNTFRKSYLKSFRKN